MDTVNKRDKAQMDPTPVLKTLKPIAPRQTEVVPAGYLQLPVRCLLCDIYGTLLVSAARQTRRQTEALDALLLKYGQRIHADTLLNHFHDAIEKAHTCARAQGVDFPEVKIENIWEKVLFAGSPGRARSFALEFEILMNPVWPMPGLPELLSAARRFSIVMGIISNAQFYTPIIMEYLLGRNLESAGYASELTFFSFEHGRAKPSRHLFQLAVNRLNDLGVAPPGDRLHRKRYAQ